MILKVYLLYSSKNSPWAEGGLSELEIGGNKNPLLQNENFSQTQNPTLRTGMLCSGADRALLVWGLHVVQPSSQLATSSYFLLTSPSFELNANEWASAQFTRRPCLQWLHILLQRCICGTFNRPQDSELAPTNITCIWSSDISQIAVQSTAWISHATVIVIGPWSWLPIVTEPSTLNSVD